MALTKLPKNAFGTGSVDASKIEDGTIQNVELTDATLTSEKFATGTIANASLSNSTITINGTSISLGGSTSIGVEVNWQSVQTTGFTAVAGNGYFVDTTSGAITVTLPASASLGDQIAIKDYAGTFATNKLTIGRNGHNIQGVANDSLISTNRASLLLVYVDSTKGWIYAEESNVGDLGLPPEYVTATGGTVTTSGNYKIHTFTGDGSFVVSNAGLVTPTGGSDTVDYLVLAGGGSGGYNIGGGGGAGGYRESHSTCVSGPYTASPLATPTGVTVSATTYPITVGGGAAGSGASDSPGNQGSNSVFSTITSTGGGGGGSRYLPGPGLPGGSGGGGGVTDGCAPSFPTLAPCGANKGSGNTPSVSPPQGNDGGGVPGGNPGSGGGGAGAAGTTAGGSTSGPGGNGTTSSITGSPVTRAGGGGGGAHTGIGQTVGTGGSGGGTAGVGPGTSSSSPANSGGGSGGGGNSGGQSGAGGKGIVIIRYKYQ